MSLDCLISVYVKVASDYTVRRGTPGSHQPAWPVTEFGLLLGWLRAPFQGIVISCLYCISFLPGRFLYFQIQGSLPAYLLSWETNHYTLPRIRIGLGWRLLSKPPYPVCIILVISTFLWTHTSFHFLLFWANEKIITSFPKWLPFFFLLLIMILLSLSPLTNSGSVVYVIHSYKWVSISKLYYFN